MQQQYDTYYPPLPPNQDKPWEKVEYNKKRLRNPSEKHIEQNKHAKLNDYWLNLPSTTNRFNILADEDEIDEDITADEDNQTETITTKDNTPKPPPIFVSGVQNIQPLTDLLVTVAEDQFLLKVLKEDQVKIQPKTSEKYSVIIQALAAKNTQFHTYQFKEERSFKTVLRGIHYSTDITDIKSEIEKLGHSVVSVFNIKQNRTKIPLPLFFVNLKPSDNNKDIYQVKYLLHSCVAFEPPKPKREIPQCMKCQRYGHTKAFCHHSPRCVKCAENHLTIHCIRKEKSDDVKCVLCTGNHPANYKGCTVYQELQKKSFPPLRNKKEVSLDETLTRSQIQPGTSYATALQNKSQQAQFGTQIGQLASQQIQKHTPYQHQPTSDIQELKSMMKGLMEQMGTMLNLLTTLVSKMA